MRSKTTTFASAATPIVRIRPAKPGSVSVTPKSRIAEAEEPIEDEQEERHDEEADQRRLLRLLERVLTERRRHVGALDLLEVDR
jgi:hypothetical protein